MVAGKGIVHSERTADEDLNRDVPMEGIQTWIGLPAADEPTDPRFDHVPADALRDLARGGVQYRLIVGAAFGEEVAEVKTFPPIFYLHGEAPAGAAIDLPEEHTERAIYVVTGRLTVAGETVDPNQMVVFAPGAAPVIRADAATRFMQLGGAPLDGKRTIWWNFVSSNKDRLEAAKTLWRDGGFPVVPGDEEEFIPLPED